MKSRTMSVGVMLLLLFCQLWTAPQVHAQSREGITVHGHWAIDIRQPDGTLVRHHEFENGLNGGAGTLARILSHQFTSGSWKIQIPGPTSPCAPLRLACEIWESNTGVAPSPTRVANLTMSADLMTGVITLTGSIKAPAAGEIAIVQTAIGLCAPTTAATACHNVNSPFAFTQANLPSPLPVAANQTIEFTVTISFT